MGISNHDEIATDTPKRKRVVSVWRIGGGIVMLAVIALLSQLIIVNPGTGGTVGIVMFGVVCSIGFIALVLVVSEIVAFVWPAWAAKARRCAALVFLFAAAAILLAHGILGVFHRMAQDAYILRCTCRRHILCLLCRVVCHDSSCATQKQNLATILLQCRTQASEIFRCVLVCFCDCVVADVVLFRF